MLKERARVLHATVFSLDLALIAAAFVLAYWLRDAALPALLPEAFSGQLYPLADYLPLLPLALVIWGVLMLSSGQYRSHRTVPIVEEATAILRVTATGAVIFTLTIFALRLDAKLLADDQISRSWLFLFPLLSFVLLVAEKLGVRITARYVRAHGLNYRTVLIVGTNHTAREIAGSFFHHRYWGFRILGFVANGGEEPPAAALGGLPVLGDLADLPKIVETLPVDDVIFAVARRDLDRMEDLFLSLQEQGIRTRFAMNLFPHTRAEMQLEDLDGMPLLTFSTTPTNQLHLFAKRLLDVGVAVAVLVLALPVIAVIALAIKVSSGGSVLFRQTRCGLNGRSFTLYKFRTMVEGAEQRRRELEHLNEMDGPVFKLRRDPRVTAFGRFLRKFSLDELPQLWNVLRGDMSLVGPRPPIPEEVAKYQRWQRRRLSMKPGLTCLWQISGRNEVDFDRWIQLDLEYIDSWSPMLDLKILLKTIPVVLSGRGAS
jgi:exopolysaccharide biosynthesis polyprenyl glycosylphosphotransferase